MKKEIEVLAPAGSFDCLKAAVKGGADAIYIGGSRFGARAFADNFTEEKLVEAIRYAHLYGRKIYLTINTLFKNQELEQLYDYLLPYYVEGLDAVIVQDLGVMDYLRIQFPDLPIHVSTQATVTNALSASYFKEKGVTRVVPARELSFEEVREIKEKTGLEVECFVHGALCYCYSGQCLLSSYIGGRSGNRGQCAQPCRLAYSVDGKQKDYLSLKDLCTIEMIPELIEAGIDSFKIEGRMKQPEYVYSVTKMYRKYVDRYLQNGKKGFFVSKNDLELLQSVFRRRGYTDGYYRRHNGKEMLSLSEQNRVKDSGVKVSLNTLEMDKIPVKCKVVLNSTTKMQMILKADSHEISVEGEVPQLANQRPVLEERIRTQVSKTGNTPFSMEDVEVEMTEDLFIPMQQLNELRRKGLEVLEQKLIVQEHRLKVPFVSPKKCLENVDCRDDMKLTPDVTVLVSSKEQLKKIGQFKNVTKVYLDYSFVFSKEYDASMIHTLSQMNMSCILAMPHIFRQNLMTKFEKEYDLLLSFDGVLIRNIESLMWLRKMGYEKEISSDHQLYTFNCMSKENLLSEGIVKTCAPQELNAGELKHLGLYNSTLVVYGYQPAMVTANCIAKTCGNCKHRESVLYLTDRQKKCLPVRNYCIGCYNIIYNSLPLMLVNQMGRIKELKPMELRLDFTIESGKEVDQILRGFLSAVQGNSKEELQKLEYTNGHFKRGVK